MRRIFKWFRYFMYLKNYKKVRKICDKYGIENWSINKNRLVDVNGDVVIRLMDLMELPLNFGRIRGDFDCSYNNLTTLKGAPKQVSGYFDCFKNELTSLEGAPKLVGSHFYCGYNKLTTLEEIPFDIKRLNCVYNPIHEIWKFIDNVEYLQEFVEVYDVVMPGKVVILEYLNDIRKLMGEKPVKREEIPDDWEILDI